MKLVLSLLLPLTANAQVGLRPTLQESYQHADTIVVGTVTDIAYDTEVVGCADVVLQTAALRVSDTWKGPATAELLVELKVRPPEGVAGHASLSERGGSFTQCDPHHPRLEVGESLLVLLKRNPGKDGQTTYRPIHTGAGAILFADGKTSHNGETRAEFVFHTESGRVEAGRLSCPEPDFDLKPRLEAPVPCPAPLPDWQERPSFEALRQWLDEHPPGVEPAEPPAPPVPL